VESDDSGSACVLAIVCFCLYSQWETKQKQAKADLQVPITDYTFDTAGNMFAYSEFELSGEPLAEALGLDLDVLDARKIDKPTKFDYTAGIESYEYSEEAMYEVTEKSGLGLHLIHGPVTEQLAKNVHKSNDEALADRFYELADSVGYPREEIFRNMFPTLIEYASYFADAKRSAQCPKQHFSNENGIIYVGRFTR
jgi:hypothetical protein